MESTKRTLLKTVSWETFHLVGVAGVIILSYFDFQSIKIKVSTIY